MSDSILTSIKKVLGIEEEYTPFDVDIIMHINSVFGTLHQIGIGPIAGFMIEDDTLTWSDFLDNDIRYNAVKTYVSLKVRILFDPPTTSYLIGALNEQVKEIEWRLSTTREETDYTDPVVVVVEEV